MRQIAQDKLKLILELKANPIVLVACKKQGLAPSTFYRWKQSDPRFAKEVNRAITRGRETISDIAEAHLVHAIKKGDMRAVLYWLKVFRQPYKKSDRTVLEVRPVIQKQAQEKQPRGVLHPSISSEGPTLPPKIERKVIKELERLFTSFDRDDKREQELIRIMARKGFSKEEIASVINQTGSF